MLLNKIKEWFVKSKINNNLQKNKRASNSNQIKTVGLLINSDYYKDYKIIVDQLVKSGIDSKKINILVYKSKVSKNDKYTYSIFESKNLNWNGTIANIEVNFFLEKNFDLLISYYDSSELILQLATYYSKADFKVGFAGVNNHLNDLLIASSGQNQLVFINEVLKYLKILNKI